MSEVILVVLNRPKTVSILLDAASCLASLMGRGARVNALAVHEPVSVHPLQAEVLLMEADAVLTERKYEDEHIEALKAGFEQWLAAEGNLSATASWVSVEGNTQAVVSERGARSDFVVLERPLEGDDAGRRVLRSALFGTDRPVLVVPPGRACAPFGRRVAIAWRADKQAARALIPVLRWIASSERVHVLVGLKRDAPDPVMPPIFREHDVRAELHRLPLSPGPFGQALLDKTHELEADLLVMGAYAHAPLRELILGGTTRYVLQHADLPVIMRH